MTEEQIGKKARDFVTNYDFTQVPCGDQYINYITEADVEEGYIKGYTEATKELQEEVNEWKENAECALKEQKMLQEDLGHKKIAIKTRNKRIKELEAQIEKMKSDSKTAYIKGIRTMANALKKYDREEGAWTDYFEHTVDKVLKNLLKEFSE